MPIEYRRGAKNIKYGGKEEKEIAFNNFLNKWSKNEVPLRPKDHLSEFKSLTTKILPQL